MVKMGFFIAMMLLLFPTVAAQDDCMSLIMSWAGMDGGDTACMDMNTGSMEALCSGDCPERTQAVYTACAESGMMTPDQLEGMKMLVHEDFCSCMMSMANGLMPVGMGDYSGEYCLGSDPPDLDKMCSGSCLSKVDATITACTGPMGSDPTFEGLLGIPKICASPCHVAMMKIMSTEACTPPERRLMGHEAAGEPEEMEVPEFTTTEICDPSCKDLFCTVNSQCSPTTSPENFLGPMVIMPSDGDWSKGMTSVAANIGCAECPEESSGAAGLSGMSILGLLMLMVAVN